MILCVSPNSAIDKRLQVRELAIGRVNRASSAKGFPGGKAAHVAMVAHALGSPSMWIGFAGGATGQELEDGLRTLGITVVSVRTKSPTRVNLEILDSSGVSTEVLEPGGEIGADELEEMFSTCRRAFRHSGTQKQVVLSGSLPPGVPVDFYGRLTRSAQEAGCRVSLDTSGEALLAALDAAPDLVKPNREEAEAVTLQAVDDWKSAAAAAASMMARGARSVAISLGPQGLVWSGAQEGVAICAGLSAAITKRSAVGSGDASVAGLAVGAERGLSSEETARLAVACGAANCLTEAPGIIERSTVERILPTVRIDFMRLEK